MKNTLRLFSAGSTALFLSGCMGIPYYISDAPGCTRWIGASIGGCFGTTVIKDIKLSPSVDCVTVEANNCNGGVLEINNRCEQPLVIGGFDTQANDLDVQRDESGNWEPASNGSNFPLEYVDEDTRITLEGTLGEQPVSLSFTKSGPLCEGR